ncbi:MAG: DUF1670 domain-containing protein [Candidatus Thorarchaeota archaeon]|jgi:hypothetical protein
MTKVLTKQETQMKKLRRINDKGLKQLLLYRFLNHYGYDKGEITAKAIIQDITQLIEDYFLVTTIPEDGLQYLNYGQLVWMAVPTDEYPQRGKTIAATRMKPVVLSFITDNDVAHIAHGFDSKTMRKKKLQRWTHEAFDQGALLTQLDLAVLLGVCDAVISTYVQEIYKESGTVLPTRGNIHDMSGALTHKREIIGLYLQGYLTPEIAVKTQHSKEAIDRYIKDFHRVQTLWKHGITNIDDISQLARLSKSVTQQYIDLLPEKERKLKMSKNKRRTKIPTA